MMKPILALLLATAALLTAHQAFACSCREGSIGDHFENADFVATATVKAIKKDKNKEWPSFEVTLEPKLLWKGETDDKTLQLTTATDSAACGFGFEKKKDYLVFIHKDEEGKLHTSLCSGNELASRAKEAIAWLDKNHPIQK